MREVKQVSPRDLSKDKLMDTVGEGEGGTN